jgi:MATE family multidrug resistance protein
VVLGWLIGIARTGVALVLQIAINLLNMAGTALLVLALDLGVIGAALGSVMAETAGFAAGLVVVRRLGGAFMAPAAQVFERAKLERLFAINRDIMIRTAALIAAFFFFTAQGARAGDTLLAANAVLHNFTLIGSFFLDGFATAAEQLCGHSLGARDRLAFERAVRLVIGWGLGFGLAIIAVFIAGGAPLIDLMTTSPEVREAARRFLIFTAFAPTAGVLAYAYDGIYIGATWTGDMRNLMLAALALYFSTWWALQPLGNDGLWLALLAFLLARGVLQASCYPGLVRKTFSDRRVP